MNRHSRVFALALTLSVLTLGCTPATTGKLIVSANDAQDAAAHVYDLAKTQEADATRLCVAALKVKALPLPAAPSDGDADTYSNDDPHLMSSPRLSAVCARNSSPQRIRTFRKNCGEAGIS